MRLVFCKNIHLQYRMTFFSNKEEFIYHSGERPSFLSRKMRSDDTGNVFASEVLEKKTVERLA